jgi:hypothetical protein
MAIVSMDSILRKVLSQGGKEQSAMYPPRIFQEHFNITTNWIIDEVVKLYPDSHAVAEIVRPFLVSKELPVVNGKVAFADDYRNMLGISMNVTEDLSKDCGCKGDKKIYDNDPLKPTESQATATLEKAKCISHDLRIVDIDEFGNLSTHLYKKPTYKNPISVVKKGTEIKVCPYDISHVEVVYIREPKEYVYGYKELPDHTYEFDKNTTEESEWNNTAMQYLIKGVTSLYSIYTRDGDMQNWNEVIKKVGLF